MDSKKVRVYGQILYNVTPGNAEEVEEDIQLQLMALQDKVRDAVRVPFFLLVFVYNQINGGVKNYTIRYSEESLRALINTVKDPSVAWENYRVGAYQLDSDTMSAMNDLTALERDGEAAEVLQLTHIGLYHPSFAAEMDQSSLEILYSDFPELSHFPREETSTRSVGRFMTHRFDWNVYNKGLSYLNEDDLAEHLPLVNECFFWKNKIKMEKKGRTTTNHLRDRYQISWFDDNPTPLKELGSDPIKSDIYSVPCMLYALKDQLEKDDFEELSRMEFIHGDGVKTDKVRKFLNSKNYQLVIRRIKAGDERIHTTTHSYPAKKIPGMKTVEVDYWENHWMTHYKDDPSFLAHLERGKRLGILKPMNAFEYARNYENYSFDAMIGFDDKAFLRNTISGSEFSELDYEKAVFKERNGISNVIFADFEATTDEKCHKPFLICAEEYKTTIKDGKMDYVQKDEFMVWGPDCSIVFLREVLNKYGGSNVKSRRPVVRIYFHNLKYDFTFLFPHLSEIDPVTKGGRLYSAKCCFKERGRKVYIDFWDSLPIFQKSLKKAVEEQLSKEEREALNIKKEVFPYSFYTFDLFKEHRDGWAEVAATKEHFKNEEDYDEFITNVIRLDGEQKNMYKQHRGEIYFNYQEYAMFYCHQDVRCLAAIIKKFSNLLLGTGVDGVYGTPPFSMNLMAYRTASSIGFDYFLKTVMFKQTPDHEWVPRYDWAIPKCALRAIIQKTIRGGRVMTRDNKKWSYKATSASNLLLDYDAVSLYPSAMNILWLTDGVPIIIKGHYGEKEFKNFFAPPEAAPETAQKDYPYKDGCIHVTRIKTRKNRHFPMLCVKDPKTKLNSYRNFDEPVDTWVNAIDLYNLIDFQDAEFSWDAAVVWEGERHYEIRDSIKALFDFRLENHCKIKLDDGSIERHEHPIQGVAKLMMNSIFGKSILKVSNKEKKIIPLWKWQKNKDGQWERYDNWHKFFKANLYRIHRINPISETQTEVEIYKRDVSASMNIFGSNVLAMARRIIGRVMALAEDIEEEHPELSPGLFYTDTDSMHIRADLLEKVEEAFVETYSREIKGQEMGTFHVDFDPLPGGETVRGAEESWFIAKKMYADKLRGVNGGTGYHLRMKGIPSDLIKYEYYEMIYNDQPFTFDLLSNGHISLYYFQGKVCSRSVMTRTVMTAEAREKKRVKKRQRSNSVSDDSIGSPKRTKVSLLDQLNIDTSEEDEPLPNEEVLLNPPSVQEFYDASDQLRQDIVIGDDGDTVLLPSEQPSQVNEEEIIDVE